MQVITKDDLTVRKQEIINKIKDGSIFVYPTDTIYGIGCNALNAEAVKKIREIKNRPSTPFSVIAPGKDWLRKNCETGENKECNLWIDKLPGPYTLILSMENKDIVAEETNNGLDTLGVRIPDHWFTDIIIEAGIPVVTTSANKVGQNCMTSLEDLDVDIKKHLDFIIYEGEKHGRPSKIINLAMTIPEIIER